MSCIAALVSWVRTAGAMSVNVLPNDCRVVTPSSVISR